MLDKLAVFGNYAGIISAIAATIALMLTVRAQKQQMRSTDASTLFSVIAELRGLEDRLFAAISNGKPFDRELNHYLNFLEALAASVNNKLLSRQTRKFASSRLKTDLEMLLSEKSVQDHIERAITSEDTFAELSTFWRRQKKRL